MGRRRHCHTARLGAICCGLLLAGACGEASSGGGTASKMWQGTERDSAGVRIVANPAAGIWTDDTRWTLEADLSIGVVDGPLHYQFGHVVDITVGRAGDIYVLDQQAAEVRVFDPEGTYRFSFGGRGQGPGELSGDPPGPRAIVAAPSGDLFVPDQGNARVNRFGPNGESLGSFSLRMEQGLPVAWATTPQGDLLSHHASQTWNGVLRVAPTGEVIDTILGFDVRPPGIYAEGRRDGLEHATLWTVLSDGRIASGSSERFWIEIRRPDGELERVVTLHEENFPLSRDEQERFLRRLADIWAEMFRTRGESEVWIESQVRQVPDLYVPPTHRPAFSGLMGGPEGTLWVRQALPVDSMTARVLDAFRQPLEEFWSQSWDVYSDEGRLLGRVEMPERFRPHEVVASHVLGIARDDLGIQRVVRLRINQR